MANFIVSKAPKFSGKRQRWTLRIQRPYVSATVFDNVAPGLEFDTAAAAISYATARFDVGKFQRETGRGSTTYRGSNAHGEAMPVIYVKSDDGITAIFPTECGTTDADFACYAHVGQHGVALVEWYASQPKANAAERRALEVELQGIYTTRPAGNPEIYGAPVTLYVAGMVSAWMHNARFDAFHKNRR